MKYLLIFILLINLVNGYSQKKDSIEAIRITGGGGTTTPAVGVGLTLWTDAKSSGRSQLTITPIHDTIPCIMLVCDTSGDPRFGRSVKVNTNYFLMEKRMIDDVWWQFGYEVRLVDSVLTDVSVNPNMSYQNGGTTLLGWIPFWKNIPNYTHKEYLDQNKKSFSKNIIIWITKEIKP